MALAAGDGQSGGRLGIRAQGKGVTAMRPGDCTKSLSVSILAGLLLGLLAPGASAISFHFSPANIRVEAGAGEIVNRTLSLTLAKDASSTHFKARVEDWWRSPDNERTFYAPPGTISRSCAPWCSVNPVETAVKPGDEMTVKLSIHVPDDVKPGGYWAALTIDEVPDPTQPKPAQVAMIFRASLSVGIYVEVPTATRAARITGVQVAKNRASVTIMNEGNTPLRVTGTFEFYKPGEEKPVATAQIGGEPLLPEPVNTSTFSAALPDALKLPPGRYKVRVIMDAGLDHLMGAEKEMDVVRPDDR
jgi:hypothetical protein